MYQEAKEYLYTIRDFLRWSASRFEDKGLFFGHGTDNAWDEAVSLVSQVLSLPQGVDAVLLDARLTATEKELLLHALQRRIEDRVPTPYITGKAWFANMPFNVDERVLIPRSPIAELISHNFQPWLATEPSHILDMCCGSACIGIALAHCFYEANVDCSDISNEALQLAQSNVDLHDCGDRVSLIHSDMWQGFSDQQYDLIVVNPPYVDQQDYDSMPEEFTHEPRLALTSGQDGLDFTKAFLKQAADYMTDNALLVFEVGNSGEALEQQYPDMPLTWLDFEHGGVGVFVMNKHEVLAAQTIVSRQESN